MDERFKLKVQNNPEKVIHIHDAIDDFSEDELKHLRHKLKHLKDNEVMMVSPRTDQHKNIPKKKKFKEKKLKKNLKKKTFQEKTLRKNIERKKTF